MKWDTSASATFTETLTAAMPTGPEITSTVSASTTLQGMPTGKPIGVTDSCHPGPSTATGIDTTQCPTGFLFRIRYSQGLVSYRPVSCLRLVQGFRIIGSQNRRQSHGVSPLLHRTLRTSTLER